MTSDTSPPTWAATLRERRTAAKMPRKALAAASGVSVKMIQAIELGVRRPSLETIAAIDAVLDPVCPEPTVLERLARVEAALFARSQGAA